MSKRWLNSCRMEIDECDFCEGSQDVNECPECGKDYCWNCGEYVYDKEYPTTFQKSVCKECSKDTSRFTYECPIKTCICGEVVDIDKPYVVSNNKNYHIKCFKE